MTETSNAGKALADYVRELEQEVTDAARRGVAESGPEVVSAIRRRTDRGVDRFGRRFAPYRPLTVRKRQAAGLPVNRVTLNFTGEMLGSLAHRSGLEYGSVEAYFQNRQMEKRAKYHIFGTSRMARRDFFGLTGEEVATLAKRWKVRVASRFPKDRRKRITVKLWGLPYA